jgi:hypothetical protein
MGDADNVTKKTMELGLGGEKRTLRYGMKSWRQIQKQYNGLEGVGLAMQGDQPGTIVALVDIGLIRKENETVGIDVISDWLDEYTIGECVNIATDIMNLIKSGLPQGKEGEGAEGNP